MNIDKYNKGAGNRFVLVITYDEANDLGEALQNVVDDIGVGKTLANEASDTYAYGFEIEGRDSMKKFIVSVLRTSYAWRDIEITAASEAEARATVMDICGDYEYKGEDADYSIEHINNQGETE